MQEPRQPAQAQAIEAALEPARQIPAAVPGAAGCRHPVPRCCSMVRRLAGQVPAQPCGVSPRVASSRRGPTGSKPTCRHRSVAAAAIPLRPRCTCDAALPTAVCIAASAHSRRVAVQGWCGAAPFDPGQALAIGAERWVRHRSRPFGELPRAVCRSDDAMPTCAHRRLLTASTWPAPSAGRRSGAGRRSAAVARRLARSLAVELLIGFVDETPARRRPGRSATAILVDPAAHAEAIWQSQRPGHQRQCQIRQPPSRGEIRFQNSPRAGLQFGKSVPAATACSALKRSAAAMRREFRSLRKVIWSMVWAGRSRPPHRALRMIPWSADLAHTGSALLASPVSMKAWQRQPPKSRSFSSQERHGSGIHS